MKRLPSDDDRKIENIQVRATAAQKQRITAAAKKAGIGVSTWLLMVGLERASAR